jgi:hypothetical protein
MSVRNFLNENLLGITQEKKLQPALNNKRNIHHKPQSKLSTLEARRAVEELLELRHYVDDIYEEVYEV